MAKGTGGVAALRERRRSPLALAKDIGGVAVQWRRRRLRRQRERRWSPLAVAKVRTRVRLLVGGSEITGLMKL